MAEVSTNKIAVVTGANKGIGFEICRQLASQGITVVLAARDEKRGLDAVDKLMASVEDAIVVFHQLDVTDSASAAALAHFVKSRFGKLDILVNNAGVAGAEVDAEAIRASIKVIGAATEAPGEGETFNWSEIMKETQESATIGLQTNYFGLKKTTKALLPLLNLSNSPRIVNVVSIFGMLKNIPNEWAKGILSDAENLTEERIDQVVNEYLKDVKEGLVKSKSWPGSFGAYVISKAAAIAYTRHLSREYPSLKINCVCPGFVKTDATHHAGLLTPEEGAESLVRVALLPDDGPSGLLFDRKEVSEY